LKIKVNFFAEKHGKSYCDGRFGVIKRFIRDYTNKKEKKIKTTQDIVAAIQHMAATSKSKVQSAQIILNYEKMSPSKMVYVVPNMSVFHSFEFDKDKIYACHLSSDEEVAKIYHFKSSIQRRERTIVRRGSPDLKDEVAVLSPLNKYSLRDFLTKNVLCLKRLRMRKGCYLLLFPFLLVLLLFVITTGVIKLVMMKKMKSMKKMTCRQL
jgi:hypothetical protein